MVSSNERIKHENVVEFTYTNYTGKTSTRRVAPVGLRFGSNEWHKEPQWLMKAFDVDKQAFREFALVDCDFTGGTNG